jgi:hypothetical protein
MREDSKGKSHAMSWALLILAIPVIYFATFPVVASRTFEHQANHTDRGLAYAPQWIQVYAMPYSWASHLIPALDQYYNWVIWGE